MFWYTIKHVHAHNFQVVILILASAQYFLGGNYSCHFFIFKAEEDWREKKKDSNS